MDIPENLNHVEFNYRPKDDFRKTIIFNAKNNRSIAINPGFNIIPKSTLLALKDNQSFVQFYENDAEDKKMVENTNPEPVNEPVEEQVNEQEQYLKNVDGEPVIDPNLNVQESSTPHPLNTSTVSSDTLAESDEDLEDNEELEDEEE